MSALQVTCINKQPRNDTHEGITHLGGAWGKKTRSDVIVEIENKTNSYFTSVDGKRAEVGVRQGEYGKYVQTYADGYYNDNLLALRECS
jgi:hypothetical protein